MPTTNDEADKIIQICSKYLTARDIFDLAVDLHTEVGQQSENASVKETMRMLHARALELAQSRQYSTAPTSQDKIAEAKAASAPPFQWWRIAYWAVTLGHLAIWLSMLLSCIFATIYTPAYVAFPIISFAVYLLISDSPCPITKLENYVRRKLGWPEITHFTHWYVICPLMHGRLCDGKCTPVRVGPG